MYGILEVMCSLTRVSFLQRPSPRGHVISSVLLLLVKNDHTDETFSKTWIFSIKSGEAILILGSSKKMRLLTNKK